MKLNFQLAFDFYLQHINRYDFFSLLEQHNLKRAGSIPSIAWELFGSILTGRKGSIGYGADLEGVEIKSAVKGGSFEYQYHLNTGLLKLKEDQRVDHYFCSYDTAYQSFKVYYFSGEILAKEFFRSWIPLYQKNYQSGGKVRMPSAQRRQRFRKSIPFGFVSKNGVLVMEIKDGQMIFPRVT